MTADILTWPSYPLARGQSRPISFYRDLSKRVFTEAEVLLKYARDLALDVVLLHDSIRHMFLRAEDCTKRIQDLESRGKHSAAQRISPVSETSKGHKGATRAVTGAFARFARFFCIPAAGGPGRPCYAGEIPERKKLEFGIAF